MATPTAELLITPEVSRAAIIQMQKDMNKAFGKAADDAQKQIDDAVSDGIEDGAKNSKGAFAGMAKTFGRGIQAAGIAALGVIGVGFQQQIERAQQGTGLITELLSDTAAQRQVATAKGANIDLGDFAAFSRTLQQGGFTEQQDINDVIFDIQERTADAATGGNPVLKQFVGLEGLELTNSVLASISQLTSNKQAFALAELGFGGETGQNLLSVIQNASEEQVKTIDEEGKTVTTIRKLSTDETFENLNNANQSEGEKIAASLLIQAELSREFIDGQLTLQDQQRELLLNAIDSDDIAALEERQRVDNETQLKLITQFQENQDNAIKAEIAIQTALDLAVEVAERTAVAVEGTFNYFVNGAEKVKEENAAQEVRVKEYARKSGLSVSASRTINNIF